MDAAKSVPTATIGYRKHSVLSKKGKAEEFEENMSVEGKGCVARLTQVSFKGYIIVGAKTNAIYSV